MEPFGTLNILRQVAGASLALLFLLTAFLTAVLVRRMNDPPPGRIPREGDERWPGRRRWRRIQLIVVIGYALFGYVFILASGEYLKRIL